MKERSAIWIRGWVGTTRLHHASTQQMKTGSLRPCTCDDVTLRQLGTKASGIFPELGRSHFCILT